MTMLKTWAAAAALLAFTGSARADLFDRGGGMIYDSTLKITWLSDWNLAKSVVTSDGTMEWDRAIRWANNLTFGGFDDWRLPTSLNADGSGPCGPAFNCSGSEMGHMFYNNWGGSINPALLSGTSAANFALFSNVQSFNYWSSTDAVERAWYFRTSDGIQHSRPKLDTYFAVAVRPGDVAPVPEPKTYSMLVLGLGAVVVASRRRLR